MWNDCWMARADLPSGNGGWQAVDATPQETSQGTYCCGPASLAAVRYGQVFFKYDTPFVFAEVCDILFFTGLSESSYGRGENVCILIITPCHRYRQVNSDKIYWQKNADGTFKQIYSEKNIVGQSISTKAVGSDERSDITHLYKHPEGIIEQKGNQNISTLSENGNTVVIVVEFFELNQYFLSFSGSEAERIAVETACSYGSKPKTYSSSTAQDVSVAVTLDGEGPKLGSDAELTITLRNSSSEERNVTLQSQVSVMYYTGVNKATVRTDTTDVQVLPGEGEWSGSFTPGYSRAR